PEVAHGPEAAEARLVVESAAEQAGVDRRARAVPRDCRLDRAGLVERPPRESLGSVADVRFLGMPEVEQLESSGEVQLGAAQQIQVAGEVHGETFSTRAAAYLNDGC